MNSEALVLPSNRPQLLPSKFLRIGHYDLCPHLIYLFMFYLTTCLWLRLFDIERWYY